MRIAIFGNNLASLVLAHVLSERDHQIDVYGKREVIPDLMRDSTALQQWLPDLQRRTVKSVWKEENSLTFHPARESIEGFWDKTRNSNTPPTRTHVVDGGPRALYKYLDLERFEPILGPVDSIFRLKIQGRQYDRIVTSVAPERFPGLKSAPRLTPIRYYWGSTLSGVKSPEDTNITVFCGEDHVWWHTAFFNLGRWVHVCRAPEGPDVDKWRGEMVEIYNGIQTMRGELRYPKGVISMGSFAEWKDDMTIGDAIAHIEDYVKQVEQPVVEV